MKYLRTVVELEVGLHRTPPTTYVSSQTEACDSAWAATIILQPNGNAPTGVAPPTPFLAAAFDFGLLLYLAWRPRLLAADSYATWFANITHLP